ncbi:branched-chain amino acid aminotransferase [Emcibacter nanhaiensis]|uniref:Branched-chain-amino-acid aminotransferase n=1 Tax=Emcibacter nanhaiensis TaxID=1505037 RepID=A0A501PG56_9PROT|nr:branched-chain amino acid aminotransferase [Emcibacter nanhaiensis]TPD59423.1 branched-chain amino acid aminotransferase [Emcibacter nanhaiensis]
MSAQPFDDRDGFIWYNGKLIPWREAQFHVLTHGLHYASSVFEGQRAYSGKVFKSREHSERLINSGRILGFEIPYSAEQIDAAIEETVKANGLTDAYIRPVAWRGAETMGVATKGSKVHLAIATWVWPSYFSPEAREKGLRLHLAEWRRPAPHTAPVRAKAAGLYMIASMNKDAASAEGFDDALMMDYKGRVAEATGANIFFIKDGKLHTPTVECVLDGITRQTAIELAERRGIEVIVRDIWPEEMADFDGAFLTGTAAEIAPLGEIGPYKYAVQELCKDLMDDYTNLVNGRL